MRRLLALALTALAFLAAPAAVPAMSIPACPAYVPLNEPPAEGVSGFIAVAQTCSAIGPPGWWTVGVDWGDGTWSPGSPVAIETGIVGGEHAYRQSGTYEIRLLLHRPQTGAAYVHHRVVTIADQPRTPVAVRAPRFVARRLGVSQPLVAFRDGNPLAQPRDSTATVAWGDGQTTGAKLRREPDGRFTVIARHWYSRDGRRPVLVTVTDKQGRQLVLPTQAVVRPADDRAPARRPTRR